MRAMMGKKKAVQSGKREMDRVIMVPVGVRKVAVFTFALAIKGTTHSRPPVGLHPMPCCALC